MILLHISKEPVSRHQIRIKRLGPSFIDISIYIIFLSLVINLYTYYKRMIAKNNNDPRQKYVSILIFHDVIELFL